jgi:hypothetical protein
MNSNKFISYLLILVAIMFVVITITVPSRVIKVTSYEVNCKIDSITETTKNNVLPDKVWILHTKMGNIRLNSSNYKVGDSISIKVKKFNEQ